MEYTRYFLDLLELDPQRYPVIAVVGGGGKTSLIYRLSEELQSMGKKVIISTTTHMLFDPDRPFARDGRPCEVEEKLDRYGCVTAASLDGESGKITALPMEQLESLVPLCDVMLVEADGSRQKPLKVPAKWEPAIPSFADIVISVVGLDCLGKPMKEVSHRAELTSAFLKKEMDAPVTEEDVAKIVSSIHGLFKNVEKRVYRVYLNKADVLPDHKAAEKIVEKLSGDGLVAAYGSLKEAGPL